MDRVGSLTRQPRRAGDDSYVWPTGVRTCPSCGSASARSFSSSALQPSGGRSRAGPSLVLEVPQHRILLLGELRRDAEIRFFVWRWRRNQRERLDSGRWGRGESGKGSPRTGRSSPGSTRGCRRGPLRSATASSSVACRSTLLQWRMILFILQVICLAVPSGTWATTARHRHILCCSTGAPGNAPPPPPPPLPSSAVPPPPPPPPPPTLTLPLGKGWQRARAQS